MSERLAIAGSFARAAGSYDEHAALQLAVARDLDSLIAELPAPQRAMDLGAGTAPLLRAQRTRWPSTRWLVVDIAEAMLREAKDRGRLESGCQALCADAMALPLTDASLDLLFSSFALQWCDSLPQLAGELARVLRPGAILAISVPVAGTLTELRESWASADHRDHVNALPSASDWQQALTNAGFVIHVQHQTRIRQHYPDLRAIGSMLRATGAHHVFGNRPGGLTGRGKLAAVQDAYEKLREQEGLPLSWQVCLLLAEKTGD